MAFLALALYSETPSRASIALEKLSAVLLQMVGYQPSGDTWLLVMAVHPQCACTRASIRELERVVVQCRAPVVVRFLNMIPSNAGRDWLDTRLVSRTDRMVGSESIPDQDRKIAEQLGMFTSGAVILCSPNGQVKFSGGITIARGHDGDNLGRSSIVSIVNTGLVFETSTPTNRPRRQPTKLGFPKLLSESTSSNFTSCESKPVARSRASWLRSGFLPSGAQRGYRHFRGKEPNHRSMSMSLAPWALAD